jgi:hypothetical protein
LLLLSRRQSAFAKVSADKAAFAKASACVETTADKSAGKSAA